MKRLITAIYLLIFLSASGQEKSVTNITANYDSTAIAELYNQIPIGFNLTYSNGLLRQTEGFLRGNYRWNRMQIVPSNGTFRNGYLSFDRTLLAQQNYKIQFTVTMPEAPQSLTASITLPALDSIRFHHYADSLKRNIHFYLNVEGIYNNGKIFPLDTSTVTIEISDGKLLGQDLLVTDPNITSVTVTAICKYDKRIKALSTVPVKKLQD